MTQEIIWEPQPQQAKLITCPCFEVFFGGARGGGKTDAVLGEFISHADLYGENAIGLMVRRTRTELVETIERSRALYTALGAKFNETDKMWRFPNGARLRFAYLERDSDADAYQGHSYTRLYIEEAGTFPSIAPILKLMATLRSGAGVPVGIRLTGNPGGPGQQWVKDRYIDPAPEGLKVFKRTFENPWTKEEVSRDWVYIPSKLRDNRYLGNEYVANLQMSGGPKLVRAWLEGDFGAVEGAFFDNWDPTRHVIAPFAIPEDWLRFRSMDWGSASPASVGWWAVCGDPVSVDCGLPTGGGRIDLPRGCLIRYREWYVASGPNKGLKLTAEELALGIKKRTLPNERISYSVLDPSAFKEDGGPSIAERMFKSHGVLCRPADNKRVSRGTKQGSGPMGGWDQMRARLTGDADGKPMAVCFNTCVDSIRTIPVLQHDTDKQEDLDTEAEDHCFAAGTFVDTDHGTIPIQKLDPAKHRVWSAGDWRSNYTCRMTRRAAVLVRLTFSSGKEVVCTPDHKFLDCSGEWRYAKDLQNVEVSCDQSSSVLRFRPSRVFDITYADGTSSIRGRGCTALSGPRLTDPFRPTRTYTIRMATHPITPPTISNALLSRTIWAIGMGLSQAKEVGTAFALPVVRLLSGTDQLRAGLGTPNTTSCISVPSWSAGFQPSAKNAAKNTSSAPDEQSRASIVTLTVAPELCVSVESAGRGDVYCLDEPETRAFTIEGGLIVHNCADEWRYACMSRPWIPSKAQKEKQGFKDYKPKTVEGEKPGDWMSY